MQQLPDTLLRRMSERLNDEDRDEMAIPSYLHPNPLLRGMAWRRVKAMASRFRDIDPERPQLGVVVDFGCGSGVLFAEASRRARQVYGVDIVLEPARMCREEFGYSNIELLEPGEMVAHIRRGSVDVILAAEVLEHVEPLPPALDQFRELLAPHGHLLASLPTENAVYRLGRRLAGFEGHYHHSNAKSIDRDISRSGFRRVFKSCLPLPSPFDVYWIVDYVRT